ncbi:hypothetical protein PLICRDRAFT_42495 [Plicaturopsis crispa FD-325 SS-3]|nr:hypothetical protein PLICRDRAFT_42495 [Plicaturopsis crispa FD-325 SS-3]
MCIVVVLALAISVLAIGSPGWPAMPIPPSTMQMERSPGTAAVHYTEGRGISSR